MAANDAWANVPGWKRNWSPDVPCTCDYPEVVLRNGCGHPQDCPQYQAWLELLRPDELEI